MDQISIWLPSDPHTIISEKALTVFLQDLEIILDLMIEI